MSSKLLGALLICACGASFAADAGIEEFNRALIQATTQMDNAAVLALWEDDGIALLPQTKPMIGKKVIAGFLNDVSSQLPGARMEKFEMKCFDAERTGDSATEMVRRASTRRIPQRQASF
jgi:ketosteroid isomerase-like protein